MLTPDRPGILLVYADTSLGGTSRSALQSVRAWRSAGRPVYVLALAPVAPGRDVDPDRGVQTVAGLGAVPWDEIGVVHLHHWNWARDERERVHEILAAVQALEHPPRLLTNNIFSSPDSVLRGWPAPAAVGVLGTWSVHQYLTAMAGRPHPVPFVVANPQDTAYFRPPTPAERARARAALGLDERPVVLRIGSPLANKWSPAYGPLAAAADANGLHLVLVSPPASVRADVEAVAGTSVLGRIDDDDLVRSWYWAADVFALDAERGESFGNVILEALGTGLPVVYRGRPLRDNTPWEFRDLPGFRYVRGRDAWVSACVAAARLGRDSVAAERANAVVEQRYGVASVGRALDAVAQRLLHAPDSERLVSDASACRRAELDLVGRAAVAIRHNPAAAVAKVAVNRLRSSGAGAGVELLALRRGRRRG